MFLYYNLSMVHFREFDVRDGQGELDFLKSADLEARGFKIVGAFEGIETVERMRVKIKELQELSESNPCERKFFWILKDDIIIGVITLRLALNGFLLRNAGHIGIAINKPCRGHGYGTEAFKKMCEMADTEYGIKDIVVMALVDNAASRMMIEKAGGKHWDTITAADGEKLARYWVKVG